MTTEPGISDDIDVKGFNFNADTYVDRILKVFFRFHNM